MIAEHDPAPGEKVVLTVVFSPITHPVVICGVLNSRGD